MLIEINIHKLGQKPSVSTPTTVFVNLGSTESTDVLYERVVTVLDDWNQRCEWDRSEWVPAFTTLCRWMVDGDNGKETTLHVGADFLWVFTYHEGGAALAG